MKPKLIIIANNNIGPGQSGGDTIFLGFIKYWQDKLDITVFGSQETVNLLKREGLQPTLILTDKVNPDHYPSVTNLIKHTFRRLFSGTLAFINYRKLIRTFDYCYTVSDFIPDFIFGLFYKLYHKNGYWISGQFLFAPSPFSQNSPYHHQPLKGFLYFSFQLFTARIARLLADCILVTSKPDTIRFPGKRVVVVQGGIDTTIPANYFKINRAIPIDMRKYDAVFQGRLHPQKGVLELVDIWNLVIQKKPNARLAIIGDGQLEKELLKKIENLGLKKNISFLGFRSGQEKHQIFADSRIVVHPAIYDSGGMAAAEAMAWGLPGVSFDLEALKTYYPQGLIKTPCFDQQCFAANIIKLLDNNSLYRQMSKKAVFLINTKWDWQIRSKILYDQIFISP